MRLLGRDIRLQWPVRAARAGYPLPADHGAPSVGGPVARGGDEGLRNGRVYIYTLAHPLTGEVRYVGKSIDPEGRLRGHITEKGTAHKNNWIRSLLREGLTPKCEVLEELDDPNDCQWQEAERFWINSLRFLGCRLTNLEDGGIRGKRLSLESRQKISATKRSQPEEARTEINRKISAAKVGIKKSEEAKARMRVAFANRSGETYKKVSEGNKRTWALRHDELCANMRGRKLPQWEKDAISRRFKGVKQSEEHIKKRADGRRGCHHSEEALAKLRIAARRRAADPEWRRNHSLKLMGRKLSLQSIAKREATRKMNRLLAQNANTPMLPFMS
jgi:hypothetical protein